jgi:hypothetical protein
LFDIERVIPLIPIALIVAVRIIATRKNHIKTQEQGKRAAFLGSTPKAATSPGISMGDKKGIAAQAAVSPAMKESIPHTAAVTVARGKSFPENLSYLPPLKRAIVLAEILGSPKGL